MGALYIPWVAPKARTRLGCRWSRASKASQVHPLTTHGQEDRLKWRKTPRGQGWHCAGSLAPGVPTCTLLPSAPWKASLLIWWQQVRMARGGWYSSRQMKQLHCLQAVVAAHSHPMGCCPMLPPPARPMAASPAPASHDCLPADFFIQDTYDNANVFSRDF